MERRTAQVAFLVDCGVIRQPDLSIQQISQLIRLSCLRILSSFQFNKLYKDLRWGYRFYNLDSLPLSAHRHTNWKEFTLESYEDYEAKLENALSRHSTMVKTPRKVHPGVSEKPSGGNTAGESEYFSEKSPAAVYSNVLCAVIEDFQWDAPDISTPVKRNRGYRKSYVLNPSIENYVFNFQLCPETLSELSQFTGSVCDTPAQLADTLLMRSAKKRWDEKGVRLYWVDSRQSASEITQKTEITQVYRDTLKMFHGDVLHTSYMVELGASNNKNIVSLLPSGDTVKADTFLVPMSEVIYKVLHRTSTRDLSTISNRSRSNPQSNLVHICDTQRATVFSLQINQLTDSSLNVQYLYLAGLITSHAAKLHYFVNKTSFLCQPESTASNEDKSKISLFLIELACNGHVLILRSMPDDTFYVLKPLTVNTATVTAILPQYTVNIEKQLIQQSPSLKEQQNSAGDDVDHFAGSMIDHRVVPAHSMKTAETAETKQNAAPQYVNRTKKAPQALKDLYSFMKKPKSLIRAAGSRVVPVKEEKVSPVKPKKNRLVKRLSLARGAKHLEKAAENKRNSTGNSQDTKGPPEDGEVKVKQEKSDTPTRKKIALTTVSNIELHTESALMSYITESYESACIGQSESIYLTAQSIINTSRVYYKNQFNLQESVDKLLHTKMIKSARDIRRSCASNPERKVRECQLTCLLILELEALKHEINQHNKDIMESNKDEIVGLLEDYITAMSMGKPQLLKDFLFNSIIPYYQLTLAPLLALLLTDFGQDLPLSLKRFLVSEETEAMSELPSLGSVSSRRSSIRSPASMMIPSITSLYSEPGENSLLTTTLFGGVSRKFGMRSNSDAHCRRSIAVPGELLKKQRKSRGRRRVSDQHKPGVASRTRSKTPKKATEPLLTEFPKGFLSRLDSGLPLTQSLTDLRRSPRVAGMNRSAATALPPSKTGVKRDLFASPTTSYRRSLTTARSPRRVHRTPQKLQQTSAEENERMILVAETPHHKQGRSSLAATVSEKQAEDGLRTIPDEHQVVEESPEKPTDGGEANMGNDATAVKASSGRRRFNRRKSFYDMERSKSRNIEKLEKLETRMKTNTLGVKCSPRRITQLIFRQALSQPMNRVASRLSPKNESPSKTVDITRKSKYRKSASMTQHALVGDGHDTVKPQPKKKLFMSPTTRSTTKTTSTSQQERSLASHPDRIGDVNLVAPVTPHKSYTVCETPEKASPGTPLRRTPRRVTPRKGLSASLTPSQQVENVFTSPDRQKHQHTPCKLTNTVDKPTVSQSTEGPTSRYEAGVTTHPRKRKLSRTDQLILSTPTKSAGSTQRCFCGTPTPKRSRKSPLHSLAISPSQQKMCQFAHGGVLSSFSQEEATLPVQASPSPKRLNFQSRKRGTDPHLSTDVGKTSLTGSTGAVAEEEITFPQLERCGILLKDNQSSNQLIEKLFSPSKHSQSGKALLTSPYSIRKSPRTHRSPGRSPGLIDSRTTPSKQHLNSPKLNILSVISPQKLAVSEGSMSVYAGRGEGTTLHQPTTPTTVNHSSLTPKQTKYNPDRISTASEQIELTATPLNAKYGTATPQHKSVLKAKGTPKYSPVTNTALQSLMKSPFASAVTKSNNEESENVGELFDF